MRAARCASALLLLAAAVVATDVPEDSLEDEVESAPFVIVVEHEDEWRCGGALVSLRTALSSASCARGRSPEPPRSLWARAPGPVPAAAGFRRVTRVAVANDSQGSAEYDKWNEGAWRGALLDMALLELEAPFSAEANARPILMATGDECAATRTASVCHMVHTPLNTGAPLRVGNAERAAASSCAKVATHWAAIADKAMCLVGPQFCKSDWGVGVVCSGRLCGVLSRSADGGGGGDSGGGGGDSGGGGGDEGARGCGDTHAALLVPHWRDFLHCAQTGHRCERDECASVCTERILIEAPVEDKHRATVGGRGGGVGGGGGGGEGRGGGRGEGGGGGGGGGQEDGEGSRESGSSEEDAEDEGTDGGDSGSSQHTTRDSNEDIPTVGRTSTERFLSVTEWPTVQDIWRRGAGEGDINGAVPTRTAPTQAPPPIQPLPPPAPYYIHNISGARGHVEFEPNRADFKVGEYGDNAANYDSGEEPVRTSSSPSPDVRDVEGVEALVERSEPPPPPPPPTAPAPASPPPPPTDDPLTRRADASDASATAFDISLRHIFVIFVLF